jgi:hypothetical protein
VRRVSLGRLPLVDDEARALIQAHRGIDGAAIVGDSVVVFGPSCELKSLDELTHKHGAAATTWFGKADRVATTKGVRPGSRTHRALLAVLAGKAPLDAAETAGVHHSALYRALKRHRAAEPELCPTCGQRMKK